MDCNEQAAVIKTTMIIMDRRRPIFGEEERMFVSLPRQNARPRRQFKTLIPILARCFFFAQNWNLLGTMTDLAGGVDQREIG